MPAHLIYIMGTTACGKTTVASALPPLLASLSPPVRASCVDADALHPRANVEKMSRGEPLDDDDRWPWLEAVATEAVKEAGKDGAAVVACSALKRKYRAVLARNDPGSAVETTFVHLRASPEVIRTRIAARKGHFMNPALVDSQFAALEQPQLGEGPYGVIVVDVDDKPEDEVLREVLEKLEPRLR
ncbi:gluconokinase [Hyaloraphidium curvatum]|nr:gluconokinase [Hyaloraphidium curvatum]